MGVTVTEEPILSRLDRLDNMLRQLEEMKGSNSNSRGSDGCVSEELTLTLWCKSLEKHCRPIDEVMVETEAKGSLMERLDHVEDRIFKLCTQLEEQQLQHSNTTTHSPKKGLKQLVKKCVPGKHKS